MLFFLFIKEDRKTETFIFTQNNTTKFDIFCHNVQFRGLFFVNVQVFIKQHNTNIKYVTVTDGPTNGLTVCPGTVSDDKDMSKLENVVADTSKTANVKQGSVITVISGSWMVIKNQDLSTDGVLFLQKTKTKKLSTNEFLES